MASQHATMEMEVDMIRADSAIYDLLSYLIIENVTRSSWCASARMAFDTQKIRGGTTTRGRQNGFSHPKDLRRHGDDDHLVQHTEPRTSFEIQRTWGGMGSLSCTHDEPECLLTAKGLDQPKQQDWRLPLSCLGSSTRVRMPTGQKPAA